MREHLADVAHEKTFVDGGDCPNERRAVAEANHTHSPLRCSAQRTGGEAERRVDRLHTERHPGVRQSGESERDGIKIKGMGREDHKGLAEVYSRVEEIRSRRG